MQDNNSTNHAYEHLLKIITEAAQPIQDDQYVQLIDQIGDARFVLMGEASHGTAEFYQSRIDISRRLIEEKGFMAIAIEGDWPDSYSVHRYIRGIGSDHHATDALEAFERFPSWMWNNKVLSPFVEWLRSHNSQIPPDQKIGFYGLDVYSLYDSIQAVIDYLMKTDPEAAKRAKERYACFDHCTIDPHHYGYLCSEHLHKPCTKEVIQVVMDLYYNQSEYLKNDGLTKEDEYFYAFQNARVAQNAEAYYRSVYQGRNESWNNRDKHMAETLENICDHLEKRYNRPAKVIVWAHNSHVGDARATEMGSSGELNLGQLVREHHPEDTFLLGFSTYEGTVTAAIDWGSPGLIRQLNTGLEGSYEALFHEVPYRQFLLPLRGNETLKHYLQIPRLQRAVGVVYCPNTERPSHYFFTHLPYQFDALIHIDKTKAVTS